jgi:hypothetical protein
MTPPSDKVRSLAPTWSKLAYEAHPAFGVGGWEEAPRQKNWALEVCCVDQCDGVVRYEDVPSGCGRQPSKAEMAHRQEVSSEPPPRCPCAQCRQGSRPEDQREVRMSPGCALLQHRKCWTMLSLSGIARPQESSQRTARPASQPRVDGNPRRAHVPWTPQPVRPQPPAAVLSRRRSC